VLDNEAFRAQKQRRGPGIATFIMFLKKLLLRIFQGAV